MREINRCHNADLASLRDAEKYRIGFQGLRCACPWLPSLAALAAVFNLPFSLCAFVVFSLFPSAQVEKLYQEKLPQR